MSQTDPIKSDQANKESTEPVKPPVIGIDPEFSVEREPLTDIGDNYDYENFSTVDVEKYNRFIPTGVFDNEGLEKRAAENQSFWSKAGGFLIQSGGEILGGTISGFGAMGAFIEGLVDSSMKNNADFNNAMMQAGEDIIAASKELAPIYRKNRDKNFDFGDWGWWFENGVSVSSTLSMLIPATGTIKGIGYLGKVLKLADKMGDTSKFVLNTMGTAAVMRNAENMRESFQTVQQTRREAYAALNNETAFSEWLNTEAGNEYLEDIKSTDRKVSASDAADYIAAKAGWHTYKINSGNIVFDIAQSALLFKHLAKATRSTGRGSKDIRAAAGLKDSFTARFRDKAFRTFTPFGAQASEGIEEAVNFIGGEEGQAFGDHLIAGANTARYSDISEYFDDPNLWESAFWGVLGGVAFERTTALMTKKQRKLAQADKLAEINNRASFIKEASLSLDSVNEQVVQGNMTPEQGAIIRDMTLNNIGFNLGLSAAKAGNVDNLLESLVNSEDLRKDVEQHLSQEGEDVSYESLLSEIKQGVLDAEKAYRKAYSDVFISDLSEGAKAVLLSTQVHNAAEASKHARLKTSVEKDLATQLELERSVNEDTSNPDFNEALHNRALKLAHKTLLDQSKSTGIDMKDNIPLVDMVGMSYPKKDSEYPTYNNLSINDNLVELKALTLLHAAKEKKAKSSYKFFSSKAGKRAVDKAYKQSLRDTKKAREAKADADIKDAVDNNDPSTLKDIKEKAENLGDTKTAKKVEKAEEKLENINERKANIQEVDTIKASKVEDTETESAEPKTKKEELAKEETPEERVKRIDSGLTKELGRLRKSYSNQIAKARRLFYDEGDLELALGVLNGLKDKIENKLGAKAPISIENIERVEQKLKEAAKEEETPAVEEVETQVEEVEEVEEVKKKPSTIEALYKDEETPTGEFASTGQLKADLAVDETEGPTLVTEVELDEVTDASSGIEKPTDSIVASSENYNKEDNLKLIEESNDERRFISYGKGEYYVLEDGRIISILESNYGQEAKLKESTKNRIQKKVELELAVKPKKPYFTQAVENTYEELEWDRSTGNWTVGESINIDMIDSFELTFGLSTVLEDIFPNNRTRRIAKILGRQQYSNNDFIVVEVEDFPGVYISIYTKDKYEKIISESKDRGQRLIGKVETSETPASSPAEDAIFTDSFDESANLFMAPIMGSTTIRDNKVVIDNEGLEVYQLLMSPEFTEGKLAKIVIDRSNPYHKDTIEDASLAVVVDGVKIGYLNTLTTLYKTIKELKEDPNADEKFIEVVNKNLIATRQIRYVFGDYIGDNSFSLDVELTKVTHGETANSKTMRQPSKVFGEGYPIYFVDPKLGNSISASQELVTVDGDFYFKRSNDPYFNKGYKPGAIYTLIKGFGYDGTDQSKVPEMLFVKNLDAPSITKATKLIAQISVMLKEGIDLNNRNLDDLRNELNSITPVNKDNSSSNLYLKVHEDAIEIAFDGGTAKIHAFGYNSKLQQRYDIEGYNLVVKYDDGKVERVNSAKDKKGFGAKLKEVFEKKKFNIEISKLSDPTYRKELDRKLQTRVLPVVDSKDNLLGQTVAKYGRKTKSNNLVVSVKPVKLTQWSVSNEEKETLSDEEKDVKYKTIYGTIELGENNSFKYQSGQTKVIFSGESIYDVKYEGYPHERGKFQKEIGKIPDTNDLKSYRDSLIKAVNNVEIQERNRREEDKQEVVDQPLSPEEILDRLSLTDTELKKKVKEGQEKANDSDIEDMYGDALFMTVESVEGTFATSSEETKQKNWARMFGDNVELDTNIHDLIYYKGEWAYGLFHAAAVSISKKAPIGTEYHEAYHVAKHLYLTEKQRAGIKKLSIKKYGKLSDKTLEEREAEEFRMYANSKGTNYEYKGVVGTLKQFFDRLLRAFGIVTEKGMNTLFDDIYSGKFNYKPSKRALEYAKGLTFASDPADLKYTKKEIEDFVEIGARLVGSIMLKNKDLTNKQVQEDKFKYSPKSVLRTLLSGYAQKPDKYNISEEQAAEVKKRLEDYEYFWKKIEERVKDKLGLSVNYDAPLDYDQNEKLQKNWDDTKAFAESGKVTFGTTLRRAIMTTPQVENYLEVDGKRKPVYARDAKTGLTKPLSFDKIYPYLVTNMATALDVTEMMDRLKELAHHDPSLYYLHNTITSSEDLKAAWVVAFKKQMPERHHLRVAATNKFFIKGDTSNKKATHFSISDEWIRNIKEDMETGVLAKKKGEFDVLLQEAREVVKAKFFESNKAAEVASKISSLLGITISRDQFKKLLTDPIVVRETGASKNTFVKEVMKPISTLGNQVFAEEPKFSSYGNLNRLASLISVYQYDRLENSFYNVNGDLEYSVNISNFLSDFFKEFEAVNDPRYVNQQSARIALLNKLQEYAQDPAMINSNWLWNDRTPGLLNMTEGKKDIPRATLNLEYIKNFKFELFDGIKDLIARTGFKYDTLSDEDWRFYKVLAYTELSDKNWVTIPIIIQSDSGNIRTITTPKIKVYEERGIIEPGSTAFEAVKNTIRQEMRRMTSAAELLFNIDDNGNITTKEDLDYSVLQANYHFQKRDKDGIPILLDSNNRPTGRVFEFHNIPSLNNIPAIRLNGLFEKDAFTPRLSDIVDSEISKFLAEERRVGLLEYRKYLKALNETGQLREYDSFAQFISEYKLNQYLANVEQFNFFLGSPAEYKNPKDTNKRAKEITSPKQNGSGVFLKETYKAITVADIMVSSPMLDNMIEGILPIIKEERKDLAKESFSKENIIKGKPTNPLETKVFSIVKGYRRIEATDAQGYITLDRYESILKDYGRWNKDIERVVNLAKAGKELKLREITQLMQPLKPFYYSRRYDPPTRKMISKQVKLSVVPLIPNFVKNVKLKELSDWLVANNVDEIYFESAVKVGKRGVQAINDLNPDMIESYFNRDWGLQLDVPDHIRDTTNLFGTQISKIILANIKDEDAYLVDGEAYFGKDLKTHWNELVIANIEDSAKSLIKRIGAKKQDDGSYIVEDLNSVSEILESELKSRNMPDNYIQAIMVMPDGKFNMPLFFSGMTNKFEQILTSLFTNNITNQKLPGSHAVLMSSALIEVSSEEIEGGIVWSKEVLDRKDKKLRHIKKEGGKIIEAEALLPAWTKEFYKEGELIDINELPEEVRKLIMYRIPTQAKHSMIVLKAVGFLPSSLGSAMAVSDEVVAMMGSDFDVDSGYNIHKHVKEGKLVEYNSKKLPAQNSRQARDNRIVSVMQAILSNGAHFKEMVTPAEFNDMIDVQERQKELLGINDDLINPNTDTGQNFFRSVVISGRALKGMSADANGILPVMQEAKMYLADSFGLKVKYTGISKEREKALRNQYGKDFFKDGEDVIINHRNLGFAPDGSYLNIRGDLITEYASQSLSNILDIVKEGIPLNLNTYTFYVFQSYLMTGSTIDYAGMLIRQPIIQHATDKYFRSNSLLDSSSNKEIEFAKRLYQTHLFRVLNQLGATKNIPLGRKRYMQLTKEDSNGNRVWDNNKLIWLDRDDIEGLLNYSPDELGVYSTQDLENNLKDYLYFRGKKNEDLSREDLVKKAEYLKTQLRLLNSFQAAKKTAFEIQDAISLLAFDKVGAGPSLYLTDRLNVKMARSVERLVENDSENPESRLLIDKAHYLTKVYPEAFGLKEESAYPILEAYRLNSNELSTKILDTLFIHRSPAFRSGINNIMYGLSSKLDDRLARKINSFFRASIYNDSPILGDITIADAKRILGIDSNSVIGSGSLEEFKKLPAAQKVALAKKVFYKEELEKDPFNILHFLTPQTSISDIERNNGIMVINFDKPKASDNLDDYLSQTLDAMKNSDNEFVRETVRALIEYDYVTNRFSFGSNSLSNYFSLELLNDYSLREHLYNKERQAQDVSFLTETLPDYYDLFIRNHWYDQSVVPVVYTKYEIGQDGYLINEQDAYGNEIEGQYKTVNDTPVWTKTDSYLTIPIGELKNEGRNIATADYLLYSYVEEGEQKSQLLMRIRSMEDTMEDGPSHAYYVPVSKLGSPHLKYEFSSDSIIDKNNVAYSTEVYARFAEEFGNLPSFERYIEEFYEEVEGQLILKKRKTC
jgi:hypothetical protein